MLERPVLQGVESSDAGDRKHDHGAELAADRAPVALKVFPGEGQNNEKRDSPAQERERHRRNMPGGEAADDGIAGPAQRREREQQIRLVGEPVAGGGGIGGLIGSAHEAVVFRPGSLRPPPPPPPPPTPPSPP